MHSRWNDADARAGGARPMPAQGIGEMWRLRTYTTRLLGGDPLLVLHGGGNTSVKTRDDGPAGRDARGAVRQGLGLGHGQRSSRRACRR